MERSIYIVKRLEKELTALGYEPDLYGKNTIAVHFTMDEETPESYRVTLRWEVDDVNSMILFRAERSKEIVFEEHEETLFSFCNDWNKTNLYGTAIYDREQSTLHLNSTLPLPEQISDMFLLIQIYLHPARAAEHFFDNAQNTFVFVKTQ